MSERSLQRRVIADLEADRWFVIKLHGNQFQRAGMPDVMALRADNEIWMIEFKDAGETQTPLQAMIMRRFKKMGFRCSVVDSFEEYVRQKG